MWTDHIVYIQEGFNFNNARNLARGKKERVKRSKIQVFGQSLKAPDIQEILIRKKLQYIGTWFAMEENSINFFLGESSNVYLFQICLSTDNM